MRAALAAVALIDREAKEAHAPHLGDGLLRHQRVGALPSEQLGLDGSLRELAEGAIEREAIAVHEGLEIRVDIALHARPPAPPRRVRAAVAADYLNTTL